VTKTTKNGVAYTMLSSFFKFAPCWLQWGKF